MTSNRFQILKFSIEALVFCIHKIEPIKNYWEFFGSAKNIGFRRDNRSNNSNYSLSHMITESQNRFVKSIKKWFKKQIRLIAQELQSKLT